MTDSPRPRSPADDGSPEALAAYPELSDGQLARLRAYRILADPRVEVHAATEVTRLAGGDGLERITLTHRPTGNEETRS